MYLTPCLYTYTVHRKHIHAVHKSHTNDTMYIRYTYYIHTVHKKNMYTHWTQETHTHCIQETHTYCTQEIYTLYTRYIMYRTDTCTVYRRHTLYTTDTYILYPIYNTHTQTSYTQDVHAVHEKPLHTPCSITIHICVIYNTCITIPHNHKYYTKCIMFTLTKRITPHESECQNTFQIWNTCK